MGGSWRIFLHCENVSGFVLMRIVEQFTVGVFLFCLSIYMFSLEHCIFLVIFVCLDTSSCVFPVYICWLAEILLQYSQVHFFKNVSRMW